MRVYRYGKFFKWLYPKRMWFRDSRDKVVYLTFDDGPVPEVTPFVLEELDKINAKATFFVVGGNVERYSNIFKSVLSFGHSIGNHTMNHVNGGFCGKADYVQNVKDCEKLISKSNSAKLFRPPYGKLTKNQEKGLSDYRIVMWSVLGYDFDNSLSSEECLSRLKKYTKPGSIVLLHDSIKTYEKLKFVLPKYLDFLQNSGYELRALDRW